MQGRFGSRSGGREFGRATFSALDGYVFTLCRRTRNVASVPTREQADLGRYLPYMLARDAVRRAMAAEQLQPLFF